MNYRATQKTGRRPSYNLAFPAGGIRRPHPRLVIGGRGCGNAWSLADMRPPHPRKTGKTFVEDEVSLERIFVGDKDEGCGAITEDTGAFGA